MDGEFLNFSDQLRLQTSSVANLSLADPIWSDPFLPSPSPSPISNDFNPLSWKKLAFFDNKSNRFNNGTSNPAFSDNKSNRFNNDNSNPISTPKNLPKFFDFNVGNHVGVKNLTSKPVGAKKGGFNGGKGSAGTRKNGGGNSNDPASVDKRFKTLPPSESLPRSEAIGGYIFVCNNDTMQENLKRQLFGLPQRYRDSVRAITPGLPIFLYNYSTHQLHGIFEAASFGGTNIDPTAWEDKKKPGESRFPAQVKVMTRKNCDPLEEDSFRPILHHYDGPKFRLELSVPEALDVLDKFAENNA